MCMCSYCLNNLVEMGVVFYLGWLSYIKTILAAIDGYMFATMQAVYIMENFP